MPNKLVNALRWGGLGLGFLILLVFLAFAVGEEGHGPPLFKRAPETFMTWCLIVWFLGFFVACRWAGVGAILSLLAIGGFYGINFAMSASFPGGPVFPLMWVPPIVLLSCWLLLRRKRPSEGGSC